MLFIVYAGEWGMVINVGGTNYHNFDRSPAMYCVEKKYDIYMMGKSVREHIILCYVIAILMLISAIFYKNKLYFDKWLKTITVTIVEA